jgi:hypothetical protein
MARFYTYRLSPGSFTTVSWPLEKTASDAIHTGDSVQVQNSATGIGK